MNFLFHYYFLPQTFVGTFFEIEVVWDSMEETELPV
jgi:hypothetical protein